MTQRLTTRWTLGVALLLASVVGVVVFAAQTDGEATPGQWDESTEAVWVLRGQSDLPSPQHMSPTAKQTTVFYPGVADRSIQDRIANRARQLQEAHGWRPVVLAFVDPRVPMGLPLPDPEDGLLRKILVDETYRPIPGDDQIVLGEDFVAQATEILDGVLRRHPKLFPTDSYRGRATADFRRSLERAIEAGEIDLSRSSEERRAAILTSLRDLGSHHLGLPPGGSGLGSGDAPYVNGSLYLNMPERLKGLAWRVLMALRRGDLDADAARRLEEHRRWVLDFLGGLPDDRMKRKPGVLAMLAASLRDPLETPFDWPLTDTQFARFRERLGTRPKRDPHGGGLLPFGGSGAGEGFGALEKDEGPLKTLSDGTVVVVEPLEIGGAIGFELVSTWSRARWEHTEMPTIGGEKPGGFGGGGDSMRFCYAPSFSGSPEVDYRRRLTDFAREQRVIDFRNRQGQFVKGSAAVRDGETMLEWVRSSQRGDLIRRGAELVALRGGKLLRIDSGSWPAADAIDEETLRGRMRSEGTQRVDLSDIATDGRGGSVPRRGRPELLVLRSAEGTFWTVALESIADNGDFVVRSRRHPVSWDGPRETRPDLVDNGGALATLSGKIVDHHGKPVKRRGRLYHDTRFHRGRMSGLADECTTDRFWTQVPAGQVSLGYFCRGYAPCWLTFGTKPGQTLDQITLRLAPGRPSVVRVVDEAGEPLAGATVIAQPNHEGIGVGPRAIRVTDDKGECVVEDADDYGMMLEVVAAGYQQKMRHGSRFYRVREDRSLVVTMARPRRAGGVVLNPAGEPLAGAKLYFRDHCGDDPLGEHLATTDGQGRFIIRGLKPVRDPLLLVEAADGAIGIYRDLRTDGENEIVIPKRVELLVTVRGDLQRLGTDPVVEVRQTIPMRRPEDQPAGARLGSEPGFILVRKPAIEPAPEGGVLVLPGVAIECDPRDDRHASPVAVLLRDGGRFRSIDASISRGGTVRGELVLSDRE